MKGLFCEITDLKRRVKLDADLIDRKFGCGKEDPRRGQKNALEVGRGRVSQSDIILSSFQRRGKNPPKAAVAPPPFFISPPPAPKDVLVERLAALKSYS